MARTLRRGKPSRNLHHYLNLDVVWGEGDCYCIGYPLWMDNPDDQTPYSHYVAKEVRRHHQDKYSRGLPRFVRQIDVNRQRREHGKLIHQAMRSGDFDVALTPLDQRASWAYQ